MWMPFWELDAHVSIPLWMSYQLISDVYCFVVNWFACVKNIQNWKTVWQNCMAKPENQAKIWVKPRNRKTQQLLIKSFIFHRKVKINHFSGSKSLSHIEHTSDIGETDRGKPQLIHWILPWILDILPNQSYHMKFMRLHPLCTIQAGHLVYFKVSPARPLLCGPSTCSQTRKFSPRHILIILALNKASSPYGPDVVVTWLTYNLTGFLFHVPQTAQRQQWYLFATKLLFTVWFY